MKRYNGIREEFYDYMRSNTDKDHLVPVFKNPTANEWQEISDTHYKEFAKLLVGRNHDMYVWGDFRLFHNERMVSSQAAMYAGFAKWDGFEFDLYIRGWDEVFERFEDWINFQNAMYDKHPLLGRILENGSMFDEMDQMMLRHRR